MKAIVHTRDELVSPAARAVQAATAPVWLLQRCEAEGGGARQERILGASA